MCVCVSGCFCEVNVSCNGYVCYETLHDDKINDQDVCTCYMHFGIYITSGPLCIYAHMDYVYALLICNMGNYIIVIATWSSQRMCIVMQ